MDRDSIERVRSATFSIVRKGYDKREVERFLTQLAEWLETGGGDQARSGVVRRELERVGEKTGEILTAAHDAAEQVRTETEQETTRLREETDRYSDKTRTEADQYSQSTRSAADDYSKTTRSDADNYAAKTNSKADRDAEETRAEAERQARAIVEEANNKAQGIVEEGNRRRQDIENKIAELVSRRDAVLSDMERLTGEISSAVGGRAGERLAPQTDFAESAARREAAAADAAGDGAEVASTNGKAKEPAL